MTGQLTAAFVAAGDKRPRCGAERPGVHPCIRVAEDCQGSHYDKLGRTWTDQDHIRPVRRCSATPPAGHSLCTIPTTNFPVTEATPHEGGYLQHCDKYGRMWETPVIRPKVSESLDIRMVTVASVDNEGEACEHCDDATHVVRANVYLTDGQIVECCLHCVVPVVRDGAEAGRSVLVEVAQ